MMMVNLLSRSEDSICFNRFCAGLKAQGLGFVDGVFPQVGWVFGCLFQVENPVKNGTSDFRNQRGKELRIIP